MLKLMNECWLSSCLSWPMKVEKIASKSANKSLSWTSWGMRLFTEGNKTPPATSECLLQFSSFLKKRAKKACNKYALHMSDFSRHLSNQAYVFIFVGKSDFLCFNSNFTSCWCVRSQTSSVVLVIDKCVWDIDWIRNIKSFKPIYDRL